MVQLHKGECGELVRNELLEIADVLNKMRSKMASGLNPQHLTKEGLALHAAILLIERIAESFPQVLDWKRFLRDED